MGLITGVVPHARTSRSLRPLNSLKTSITSFDLLALIREIQPQVTDSHLVNIYQASPKLLILKLRTRNAESYQLLLEAAKRIHLTSSRYKTAKLPPVFCAMLRKHLRNGILTEISQRDLDRLVIFEIKNGPARYKLIIELLDRGNIVLTDGNLTIIAVTTTREKTTRPTTKGATYVFPRIRGLDIREAKLDDAFNVIQRSKSDTIRTLVQFLNLPGEVAEEVCLRTGISKVTPASALTLPEVESLLEQARLLAREIEEEPLEPVVVRNKETLESVLPRRMRLYDQSNLTEFGSFSEALEEYFQELNLLSRVQREIEAQAKWKHVIADQIESASRLAKEAKQFRELGSLIFAHLNPLEQLLATLNQQRKRLGDWKSALQSIQESSRKTSQLQVQSIDPHSGRVSIELLDNLFELDAGKGAAANASEYYEKAKQLEGKAKRASESIEETRRKLEVAAKDSREGDIEEKKTLTRKHWYERFRWFISSEGLLAVGGRDASQNDTLIKKHLETNDVVVHADVHGAPFVIVKPDQKVIGEPTIEEAAQFAISYSSAWRGGLGSADAYWIRPDQVSYSAPSGEYLGKGAFMIRGERNFCKGISLRLSVGVQLNDGTLRIIAGPGRAVRSHARVSVSIIPGGISPEKLAPQLRYRLSQLLSVEAAAEISRLDNSEFVRFLPQGGSRFEQGNS